MRIVLISPYSKGPIRGNIITVMRVNSFLKATEGPSKNRVGKRGAIRSYGEDFGKCTGERYLR